MSDRGTGVSVGVDGGIGVGVEAGADIGIGVDVEVGDGVSGVETPHPIVGKSNNPNDTTNAIQWNLDRSIFPPPLAISRPTARA